VSLAAAHQTNSTRIHSSGQPVALQTKHHLVASQRWLWLWLAPGSSLRRLAPAQLSSELACVVTAKHGKLF
jgi:hypothetical protein